MGIKTLKELVSFYEKGVVVCFSDLPTIFKAYAQPDEEAQKKEEGPVPELVLSKDLEGKIKFVDLSPLEPIYENLSKKHHRVDGIRTGLTSFEFEMFDAIKRVLGK